MDPKSTIPTTSKTNDQYPTYIIPEKLCPPCQSNTEKPCGNCYGNIKWSMMFAKDIETVKKCTGAYIVACMAGTPKGPDNKIMGIPDAMFSCDGMNSTCMMTHTRFEYSRNDIALEVITLATEMLTDWLLCNPQYKSTGGSPIINNMRNRRHVYTSQYPNAIIAVLDDDLEFDHKYWKVCHDVLLRSLTSF